MNNLLLFLSTALFSSNALASSGGAKLINYWEVILLQFGFDDHAISAWGPVLGGLLTLTITLVIGFKYKSAVNGAVDELPSGRVDVQSLVDTVLDFIHDLGKGVIGEKEVRPFLHVIFGLFLFIWISNLTGLVPGFLPATDSFSTNLVLGIFAFLVFNVAGVKEHGFIGYLKIYAGPLLPLMPLIFFIEMIGAFARPVSLALRLYGNIFGDHLVLSVFTGLTYLVAPALLLFFGLLVACLQSFVFTLLTSIYISLSISHDH